MEERKKRQGRQGRKKTKKREAWWSWGRGVAVVDTGLGPDRSR